MSLHLLYERDEVHESPPETGHLLLHPFAVLPVDLVQRPEVMAGVSPSPQGALVADALSAGQAVHAQLLGVLLAMFLQLVTWTTTSQQLRPKK